MKKLYEFSKKYFINILIASIMSILIYITNIFIMDIMKTSIDESLYGELSNIKFIILKSCIVILLGVAFNYIFRYQIGVFEAGVLKDIREKTINHLLKISPDFIAKQDYGDMISRLSNEVYNISSYLSEYFGSCISTPIMLFIFSIYLFSLNPVLALVCLMPVFICVPIHSMLIEPVKKGQKIYVEQLGETNNNLNEVCSGIDIVKTYKLENVLTKRYYKTLRKTLETSFENDKKEYIATPLFTVIEVLPILIALCYGGYLVFQNKISIGELTAFVTGLKMLLNPLSFVYQLIIRTKMVSVSADRVFYIFECPIEESLYGISKKVDYEKVFAIRNASYRYDKTNDLVLNNINLEVKNNERVAFVGRSGCGKSTLLKLLYKNFDLTEGELEFYGINYKELSSEFLRSKISLISQDVFLFPMSILENIKLGKASATYEEIIEASKLAYCHDFILELPDGYQTIVGEKGSLLSGGQRQRISIARAFLKDSDIVLLDEPTSALDKESERLVNSALLNISKDKTVIVIAHRMNTIVDFDKIIVFDEKKISEIGTHDELIQGNGVYALLYNEYTNGQV